MRKEPWGLIIYNKGKSLAAFTGRISDDTEYINKIDYLNNKNYEFQCQSYKISKELHYRNEVENKLKCRVVPLEQIFNVL